MTEKGMDVNTGGLRVGENTHIRWGNSEGT